MQDVDLLVAALELSVVDCLSCQLKSDHEGPTLGMIYCEVC